MNNKFDLLKQMINSSHTIVVLTGAGISVPSGIPDFRSNKVIDFENILNYKFMMDNKERFWSYFICYLYYPNALPNEAHQFLVELEKTGKLNSIITQNIDGLHNMAGSKKVYPLHGNVHECYCMNCEKKYNTKDLDNNNPNFCKCGGFIRPNVTLYNEPLDEAYYHLALVASQIADMFIVIGSSLNVNPAASLINYYAGHKLVIINESSTPYDKYADLVINEDIIKVVEELKKTND